LLTKRLAKFEYINIDTAIFVSIRSMSESECLNLIDAV